MAPQGAFVFMQKISFDSLNQGQKAAAEGLFQWLLSPEKAAVVSGPGGVGKSHLMAYLIENTIPQYQDMCQLLGQKVKYDSVYLTATTNKAASVLTDLAAATGVTSTTIHTLLGLIVKEDFKTGRTNLQRRSDTPIIQNAMIIVDECSMVDKQLFAAIMEYTHDCKIIFVGDHCQLAPVFEPISQVFTNNFPMFHLTQQMRNANQPALQALCEQLRETVETGVFKPIVGVPGVIDYLPPDLMQAELAKRFLDPVAADQGRIVAYSNRQVMAYNHFIRDLRKLPDDFQKGEFLVSNSAFVRNTKTFLHAEQEVEVVDVSNETQEVYLPMDGLLHVRQITLETHTGVQLDVTIPTNYDHFHNLIRFYGNKREFQTYFALKNNYPDLRQRDACTVHKSQGSTYEYIFIDLGNISKCSNNSDVARLLYVAASRPRNRIFLYGGMASRFFK